MNTQVMLSAGQPSQVLFSLEYQVNMDTSRKLSLTSGDLRKSLILRKFLGYDEISNDKDRTVGLEFLYDLSFYEDLIFLSIQNIQNICHITMLVFQSALGSAGQPHNS